MPFDSNGNYSLPSGYLAQTGQTIQPSEHNTPLEDIAAALSSSLLRTGVAPMTGALKLADGTVTLPGLSFNTATGTGFYKTSSGFAVAISGVKVAEFAAGGIISGGVPIGAGMDWWLPTAPAGWLFPYGQACTTSFPLLRQKLIDAGNPFGTSGSDPLLPNKANRISIPKGDMSGTDVALVTTAGSGIDGKTLGATGGTQSGTISQDELPNVNFTVNGTVTVTPSSAEALGTAIFLGYKSSNTANPGSSAGLRSADSVSLNVTHNLTAASGGSGTSHKHMPPGIVCNYIIFAGA